MTTKKSNGGCKLKTPYGDLIVNEKGEVFQNGKQLTQGDELYDSDTDLSVCIEPFVYVHDKRSIHQKRVAMDDLVEAANYVQGTKAGKKDPAILHKDHDRNNYESSNLEWVEKGSPEYASYRKDEIAQIKKRNAELNPNKSFPDFMQPKP